MKAAAVFATLLLVAAAPSDEISYTAQSINVEQPGTPVKIKILRWSTEDETRPIITALAAPPAQPSQVARDNAAGRGRAGAARGRGRGPAAPPLSPIAAFTAALNRVPTVGYIWTNDITGYSIKYAWHTPLPDGTDRVVLISNRRLGEAGTAWNALPAEASAKAGPAIDYAFTLIELRIGPKGLIEGKTSLTNKIAVDKDTNTVALENYAAAANSLSQAKR